MTEKKTPPAGLPAGFSPEAVQSRIRKLRMGKISVQTKPGAEVAVRQTRHEFLFGTAVPDSLAEKARPCMRPADRRRYLETLERNFTFAVHENALKWYDCETRPGKVDYYLADRIWELCHERNIPMRGHCLFWEKEELNLPWVRELGSDELRAAVVRRALSVTGHFKGRIREFDLNNEMINGEFFQRRFGYGIISEMAWMAKAGNPEAVLYVNDYGILYDRGFNLDSYVMQIRNLLANGVPIGGIGVQGHSAALHQPGLSEEHVQDALDRLSVFGLPIKITECLFDVDDEQHQASELRKIFPVFFAHPNVEAILIWGFWAGDHWRPWSALWRKDWSITPQGEAFRDLVYNQWWTQASGKADRSGMFQTEGFFGEYQITSEGKTQKAALRKKDKALKVAFS
ncbi:MAG: endo-1,4-beta-xylanase [Anaerolineales bacterium]|nr:endo-1,4-beta-xylanase [Anaerolineales bacterium]